MNSNNLKTKMNTQKKLRKLTLIWDELSLQIVDWNAKLSQYLSYVSRTNNDIFFLNISVIYNLSFLISVLLADTIYEV